ncbi:MAG: CDP-alcohol phosphatidyltransferase family protein [Clostridiales Family XIII bacterium]|jgi:CDP-diacylglycerol--serine O-phosphatidyltransferase|nr:CDP-alcohol phosphatidyltransferase family protein [Clostridiales Family XIII bacterium]
MFIGKYNRSVIITYIGVLAAILGIVLAATGTGLTAYALICLIVSGVCDLFDGVYARRCKRTDAEKQFGVQIDSLADMIAFVALPIAISLSIGGFHFYQIIVIYVFYALCAIIRLAFFGITVDGLSGEPVKHYRGLPVTYAALIFPLLWVFTSFLAPKLTAIVFAAGMAIVGFLYILDIKIAKPRGVFYILFPLLAIALIVLTLVANAGIKGIA